MNNRIKLYFANFLVMAAGLWMASCSASDDNLVSEQGADVAKNEQGLTLSFITGATSFGSRTTDITTDPGATAENTINRLTIGIFSKDGNSVKFLQDLNSGAGNNAFATNGTSTTATIVASSLAKDDKVLVAVNAPANTFVGVSNVAGFNAKADQAVAALTYTAAAEKENTTEENNNIPMYGDGTLSSTNDKNFTSTVQVIHLLSKVTLESLYVDFATSSSYSAASFTPTTIFLINEPDALLFNKQAWAGAGNLLNGFAQTDKVHGTYKEFLATKTLTEKKLSGVHQGNNTQSNFDTKCYFYTMPNSEIQTGGKNTKLVVAGKFKSNATSPEETVYYPVALNAKYEENSNSYVAAETGTDVYKVYPNKNYKCTVVIKAKGAASPFDNLDPKKATITVTVLPFTDVSQTTVFK